MFEHHNASLTNVQVEIDGVVLKGVCKAKQNARDDYDDAIASGFGAYILEEGKRDDISRISIGNLPPGKECSIILRYVMELDSEGDYLVFSLPVTRTNLYNIEEDKVKLFENIFFHFFFTQF